jgi:hypothetical protein
MHLHVLNPLLLLDLIHRLWATRDEHNEGKRYAILEQLLLEYRHRLSLVLELSSIILRWSIVESTKKRGRIYLSSSPQPHRYDVLPIGIEKLGPTANGRTAAMHNPPGVKGRFGIPLIETGDRYS